MDGRAAIAARPAPAESPDIATDRCRAWLAWAATHVDTCLAQDSLAANRLLTSLAELLAPAPPRDAPPAASSRSVDERMSAVIMAVQSHDRIMQGLAHVAGSLRALREQLGDSRRAASAESWQSLRDNQLRAFSMAEERVLFARMVAGDHESADEAAVMPRNEIELFI
jgi:hypothetical protein